MALAPLSLNNRSVSEVAQLCPTLCDPMDCSLPGSSMGFSRQEYWSGLPFPSPGDLPNPGIKLVSWISSSPSLLSRFKYAHHLQFKWLSFILLWPLDYHLICFCFCYWTPEQVIYIFLLTTYFFLNHCNLTSFLKFTTII